MKKHLLLTLIFGCMTVILFSQDDLQIKNSSGTVLMEVNEEGVLVRKLTTADRLANSTGLTAADNGLLVYDTTTESFWFWKTDDWVEIDGTDLVDDADADPTNELQSWSNLPGIPADIADGDDVDDADADPTNELQNWSNLPGIPADIADGDDVDDADADPTNELQNWSNLPGIPADIADGDDVDDADADPTNELQNWSNLPGIPADIADGDDVDDADADPTNELQTISLSGNQLSLSNGGGDVTLPGGGGSDDQTLMLSGTTLSIEDGNSVDLGILQDGVDDADADPNNELQSLSLSGTMLSITGGNSVNLPTGGGNGWLIDQNKLYSNVSGSVNIGGLFSENRTLNIASDNGATVSIGNTSFNNLESGRLAFDEDMSDSDGVCGFEFVHNGSTNKLFLLSGCNIPNAGDTAWVYDRDNAYTSFKTRVKIGDINLLPVSDFHIKQSGNPATNPGSSGIIFEQNTSNNRWQLWHGSPSFNFAYNGTRVAYIDNTTGEYIQTSDARLKNTVSGMESVLDRVMALRPVRYYYNHQEKSSEKALGFLAQEVLPLFPEAVQQEADGEYYGIAYQNFGVIAIKAVQELNEKIEQQDLEMQRLQEQLNQQKAEIDQLKAQTSKIEQMEATLRALQEQINQ